MFVLLIHGGLGICKGYADGNRCLDILIGGELLAVSASKRQRTMQIWRKMMSVKPTLWAAGNSFRRNPRRDESASSASKLRQEITQIENDNDDLEKTISELLDSFG